MFNCHYGFLRIGGLVPDAVGDAQRRLDLATRFTVNYPFEVPRMVLPPNTPYVIRVSDSVSSRNVVQIYNGDQTQLLTMFMAIADERPAPTDKTEFTFFETQRGFPVPIREWFYPGRLLGLEFVYPEDQAVEIARHSREAVLSTKVADLRNPSNVTVESVEPGQSQPSAGANTNAANADAIAAVRERPRLPEAKPAEPVATTAEKEPTFDEPNAEPAQVQIEAQETQREDSAVASTAAAPSEEKDELPRTGGELPLIALVGFLCAGAGLGLRALAKS